MIEQKNNVLWHKVNGLARYALLHSVTRIMPLYVINEFPKSGGSWIGEMLSEAFGLPFPRNRLPMLSPSILHGHFMQSWNVHNLLIVWRDGRDVLISQYFHSLFKNERGNSRLVDLCRADLGFADYNDVQGNLVAFMEYVFEQKHHPRFSWTEFANRWADCNRCLHVHYEDMRINPVVELQRVVGDLAGFSLDIDQCEKIVEKHSFEKMAGRKAGEENVSSFMRKGVVGDWKNHFNREARERFHVYAGDALIRLGYENGDLWVHAE